MNRSKSEPNVIAVPFAKEPEMLVEIRHVPAHSLMIVSSSLFALSTAYLCALSCEYF
jgi:hypothetical protein